MSLYLQLRGVGGPTMTGIISRTHNKEMHARVLSLQRDIGANEKKYNAEVIFFAVNFYSAIYLSSITSYIYICL